MSPFCLIDVKELQIRAGFTHHSQVRLKPSRLVFMVQKLFTARRPAFGRR